jgi:hypothetical protein
VTYLDDDVVKRPAVTLAVVALVILVGCVVPSGLNDPALLAEIDHGQVREAWREPDGSVVIVTDLARPEAAADLCGQIQRSLRGFVWVRYGRGWWPWDEDGDLGCID